MVCTSVVSLGFEIQMLLVRCKVRLNRILVLMLRFKFESNLYFERHYIERSIRKQQTYEYFKTITRSNTIISTIFRLSLVANYDSCSSVYTAVQMASWTWTQIGRDREIMTLGRIKTILDQICLIWIKFLVKDKTSYPKPWSSHDHCFIAVAIPLRPQRKTLSSWWHP